MTPKQGLCWLAGVAGAITVAVVWAFVGFAVGWIRGITPYAEDAGACFQGALPLLAVPANVAFVVGVWTTSELVPC